MLSIKSDRCLTWIPLFPRAILSPSASLAPRGERSIASASANTISNNHRMMMKKKKEKQQRRKTKNQNCWQSRGRRWIGELVQRNNWAPPLLSSCRIMKIYLLQDNFIILSPNMNTKFFYGYKWEIDGFCRTKGLTNISWDRWFTGAPNSCKR